QPKRDAGSVDYPVSVVNTYQLIEGLSRLVFQLIITVPACDYYTRRMAKRDELMVMVIGMCPLTVFNLPTQP
ncbi:hypothetical protein, partial [Salmonella enterica]|uniref:hypothetical protein n=1 Tax=Salmonella enterica TaxID=28901 RepID=UPI001C12BB70